MNLNYPIDVYGLKRKVFNHTVAKTYLKLKEIAQLKTYDEGYQRKRDIEHEDKIIKYLKDSSNRYLPDIIITIRHNGIDFGNKTFLSNSDFYIAQIKAYDILRVYFWTKEATNSIKIIDGNHRVSAIKRLLEENPASELENFEIGVTFIFTHDTQSDIEDELALFYYLNSKAKPLLPNDYLNEVTKNLTDSKAKEIDWWMYIFKKSQEKLIEIFENKFSDKPNIQDMIISSSDYLAKKIPVNDLEAMPIFFDILRDLNTAPILKDIINEAIKTDKLYTFINIAFFISPKMKNIFELGCEINDFYKWLKNKAKLEEFDNFENLYQTYKETYIPEDYKIFVAMEFAGNDSVFKAIDGTINQVAKEINKPLECMRIDKLYKGTTYQIMDEILEQIQHNRLLIADITNMNANVYLEVGYAIGLAKAKNLSNQIMLFVKDEGKDTKVGFDLQSYQQNRYKDTEDLREKLEMQLKAYFSDK
ncbi:MAG: DNA sulfur modification protein DndB [Aliarcobacter sp.]|nr:DNA sulfur modification protein DndB [Aliarcobacter sp.]